MFVLVMDKICVKEMMKFVGVLCVEDKLILWEELVCGYLMDLFYVLKFVL